MSSSSTWPSELTEIPLHDKRFRPSGCFESLVLDNSPVTIGRALFSGIMTERSRLKREFGFKPLPPPLVSVCIRPSLPPWALGLSLSPKSTQQARQAAKEGKLQEMSRAYRTVDDGPPRQDSASTTSPTGMVTGRRVGSRGLLLQTGLEGMVGRWREGT